MSRPYRLKWDEEARKLAGEALAKGETLSELLQRIQSKDDRTRYTSFRARALRSALLPWGPWSDRETIFDAATEGHGKFIHSPGKDNLSDPGRESVSGGPYGPYIIDKFTKGSPGKSTIYFSLSTWNPYSVVLMKVLLQLASRSAGPTITQPSTTATTAQSSTGPATGMPYLYVGALGVLAIVAIATVALRRRKRASNITRTVSTSSAHLS